MAPMLSLANAMNDVELLDFNNRTKTLNEKSITYVAEPKLDGLGVNLTYVDGNLFMALQEGTGSKAKILPTT